jgi:hypothetical protein
VDGKISWDVLFKQYSDLSLDKAGNISMRTKLKPERYAAFKRRAKEWGSSTSAILRRLIGLYSTEKIERGDILYK